jgi:hypothetical protein
MPTSGFAAPAPRLDDCRVLTKVASAAERLFTRCRTLSTKMRVIVVDVTTAMV